MSQSIPLWLHYLEFVEERDIGVAECTEAGIAKMRALFERALTSTGLHFTEGGKVWEAYRDYESALLLSMTEASLEVLRNPFLPFTVIDLVFKLASRKHSYLNYTITGLIYAGDAIATRAANCDLQHAHDDRLLHALMIPACTLF